LTRAPLIDPFYLHTKTLRVCRRHDQRNRQRGNDETPKAGANQDCVRPRRPKGSAARDGMSLGPPGRVGDVRGDHVFLRTGEWPPFFVVGLPP